MASQEVDNKVQSGKNEVSAGPQRGTSCRCAQCEMSIMLAGTASPPVCPFCQSSLELSRYDLHEPTPEAPGVVDALGMSAVEYRPPKGLFALSIALLSIFLLAIAVYLKMYNTIYFWYQPFINVYSIIVGIFILSRFLIAAFYVPPPDEGYTPNVTVVVACMNEEDSIDRTIGRIYHEGYPLDKLEVVVVNDGSTDNTLNEMLKAQGRHNNLVVVDFEKNKGKRPGMAIGALLARGEVLVYVDSDSFLQPGAIYKVVQGLADPTVAGVSGHTDVENVRKNTLTKMQDVRYFVSYRIMKAAESVFGAVSCCPGCFSAYRRSCVLNVLDTWLNQMFLGRVATYGDDRALTNYLLRNYRVLYDDQAIATTIVPEKWKKYTIQQCRWKRSWLREIFFAGRFFWRKHPIAAISWYSMMLLPLISPLVMISALFIGPILLANPAVFYLGGVAVVSLLWSMYYYEKTGRRHWWTGFVFTLSYIFFFSVQGYYALFTLRRTSWGTR